jgi:hypothetical protein
MSTTLAKTVGALRHLSPVDARLLELIAQEMLREARTNAISGEDRGGAPFACRSEVAACDR